MFNLHPNFQCKIDYIGQEKHPVIIVDNFLAEAKNLINLSLEAQYAPVTTSYPGVTAETPEFYSQGMRDLMRKPLEKLGELMFEAFQLDANFDSWTAYPPRVGCDWKSFFSIVTVRPQDLKIQQVVPHADSLCPFDLAFLHYLNGPEKGGTSFYRHRSTGFESISKDRENEFTIAVSSETNDSNIPKEYINGSNNLFERIASYDSAFNRMLIYRQTSLHSGNIPKDYCFDGYPETARVTLNTFYYHGSGASLPEWPSSQ